LSLSIDENKRLDLLHRFVSHERWVQSGCPPDSPPADVVPGYSLLSSQAPGAYGLYRNSLVSYLGELRGYGDFYEQLETLVADNERDHPGEIAGFWQTHHLPDTKFIEQWRNLFDPQQSAGLTHQNCFRYQQKYEVELPLVVLAQLRQINSEGVLDIALDRFRDRTGKFKKGVIADYIVAGLGTYPALVRVVKEAYQPKLRNTIGHNEYCLVGDEIRSLDGQITVTSDQFFRAYLSLQEVHNAIVWLLARERTPNVELARYGILSIGFRPNQSGRLPVMDVLQLEPFRQLDMQATWLTNVKFEVHSDTLHTHLDSAPIQEGVVNKDLRSWLKEVQEIGKVKCELIPVMPCVHIASHFIHSPWGEFCEHGPAIQIIIPAGVLGL